MTCWMLLLLLLLVGEQVALSAWRVAADWNRSSLVPAGVQPRFCKMVDGPQQAVEKPEGGTRIYDGAQRALLESRCGVVLNRTRPYNTTVFGCDDKPFLLLNSFGGDACSSANLMTHPTAEAKLTSGAKGRTYTEAAAVHEIMAAYAAERPADQAALYVDGPSSDSDSGYYVLMDAGLQMNSTKMQQRLQWVVQDAARRLEAVQTSDFGSDGSVIVACATLLISVLMIPTQWDAHVRGRLWGIFTWLVPPLKRAPRAVRGGLLGLCRGVISGATVGISIFSFLTVISKEVVYNIVEGWPTIQYISMDAENNCNNARAGVPTLGVTETVVLQVTTQLWSVALVCCLALLTVLIAAVVTAVHCARNHVAPDGDAAAKEADLQLLHTSGGAGSSSTTTTTTKQRHPFQVWSATAPAP